MTTYTVLVVGYGEYEIPKDQLTDLQRITLKMAPRHVGVYCVEDPILVYTSTGKMALKTWAKPAWLTEVGVDVLGRVKQLLDARASAVEAERAARRAPGPKIVHIRRPTAAQRRALDAKNGGSKIAPTVWQLGDYRPSDVVARELRALGYSGHGDSVTVYELSPNHQIYDAVIN